VKNRQLVLLLGILFTSFIFVFSACKKLNDATDLGGGLIPPIDNVNTFDTTITVEAYNGIFDPLTDTTRTFPSDIHWLGRITNDPLFGSTDADLFLELKPPFYKYSFLNKSDSLNIDSAVLVLDYLGLYGDSTIPQTVNVYEITSEFKFDSNYYLTRNTLNTGQQLGTRTFVPSILNDSVKVWLDTTKNQLRIPVNMNNFGQRLLNYDSTTGPNGAYNTDSAFRSKFKGFAIRSQGGGNALMAFNLEGANTKLAIYYRYQKGGTGTAFEDTAVTYFDFTTVSAATNLVKRVHSPQVTAAATSPAEDPIVYIQSAPGTFADIKIPALNTLSNRVVHRAELIMEQVYDNSDTTFPPPPLLHLDAYDDSLQKFRTIPFDFFDDGNFVYNFGTFGAVPQNTIDGSGKTVKIWRFNVSRYVQHILTKTAKLYTLRVSAPYYYMEEFGSPPFSTVKRTITVNESVARGRVRLHGGSPSTNPNRMRLRIIYSKL
jgi:hypothetical protein